MPKYQNINHSCLCVLELQVSLFSYSFIYFTNLCWWVFLIAKLKSFHFSLRFLLIWDFFIKVFFINTISKALKIFSHLLLVTASPQVFMLPHTPRTQDHVSSLSPWHPRLWARSWGFHWKQFLLKSCALWHSLAFWTWKTESQNLKLKEIIDSVGKQSAWGWTPPEEALKTDSRLHARYLCSCSPFIESVESSQDPVIKYPCRWMANFTGYKSLTFLPCRWVKQMSVDYVWWKRWPYTNVGVPCSIPQPSQKLLV